MFVENEVVPRALLVAAECGYRDPRGACGGPLLSLYSSGTFRGSVQYPVEIFCSIVALRWLGHLGSGPAAASSCHSHIPPAGYEVAGPPSRSGGPPVTMGIFRGAGHPPRGVEYARLRLHQSRARQLSQTARIRRCWPATLGMPLNSCVDLQILRTGPGVLLMPGSGCPRCFRCGDSHR